MTKFFRLLNAIRLSKLSFQSAQIEVDKDISKSVLNNYLDEIIYFFEATNYNMVIIEDLDRFELTDVFTKLREINLLLNESKKIRNKPITFLYALKDDMFKDTERTKFFDFIVPIIPYIHSYNSGEIFRKDKTIGISDNVIDDMSLFINDTRLLYNIINEYKIYKKNINGIKQDSLFAMIVYKNMYPKDFVDLTNDTGILYLEINKKEECLKKIIEEKDIAINELKKKKQSLADLCIKSLKELKSLYIFEYSKRCGGVSKFSINNSQYMNLDTFYDEARFNDFVENKICYYRDSRGSGFEMKIKFDDVQRSVDPTKTYTQRSQEIIDYNNDEEKKLTSELHLWNEKK